MSKIAIVTDSSAYIPAELAGDCPIFTIPLLLLWGERILKDGIDIQPDDFYRQMKSSAINPTTSQPSPNDFILVYQKLLDQGYDIFSMHLSQKLSGTIDSATQAKKMLSSDRIAIFDSKTTSMALGFQVLEVAKAISKGADLIKCEALASHTRDHCGVFFIVSDLEYLRRGGRIGGAASFLGTVFNLKPILTLREGQIEAVEKVRTMSKAIDRMLDLVDVDLQKWGGSVHISCLYSDNPHDAKNMIDHAKRHFGRHKIDELISAPLSPVIGSHVGPGTMGLCYMAGI